MIKECKRHGSTDMGCSPSNGWYCKVCARIWGRKKSKYIQGEAVYSKEKYKPGPKVDDRKFKVALDLRKKGQSFRRIGLVLGVTRQRVFQMLKGAMLVFVLLITPAQAERLAPDPARAAEAERVERAKAQAFRQSMEVDVDRILSLSFTLPHVDQFRGDRNRAQLRELLPRLAWFLNRLYEERLLDDDPISFRPCFRKFGGRLTWIEHYKSVPDVRVVCLPYGLSGAYYSVEPWITDRMAAEILEVEGGR